MDKLPVLLIVIVKYVQDINKHVLKISTLCILQLLKKIPKMAFTRDVAFIYASRTAGEVMVVLTGIMLNIEGSKSSRIDWSYVPFISYSFNIH